ncbi:MAG TPA: hypothetical protein DEV93_16000 [Chloroflexi bacterium]|nr:hypothetical protein [Chloroflexota bacterium]
MKPMAEADAANAIRIGRNPQVAPESWSERHGHDQAMERAREMGAPFLDSTIRLFLGGYGGARLRDLAIEMLAINYGWSLALENEDLEALQGLLDEAVKIEDSREVFLDAGAS